MSPSQDNRAKTENQDQGKISLDLSSASIQSSAPWYLQDGRPDANASANFVTKNDYFLGRNDQLNNVKATYYAGYVNGIDGGPEDLKPVWIESAMAKVNESELGIVSYGRNSRFSTEAGDVGGFLVRLRHRNSANDLIFEINLPLGEQFDVNAFMKFAEKEYLADANHDPRYLVQSFVLDRFNGTQSMIIEQGQLSAEDLALLKLVS